MNIALRMSTLLLLLVTAASCNKDKTNDLEGDWLFPIAKGNVSINSFSELKDLNYQIQVPALSIGQPVNVPVSSPGLQLSHVGPFPVQITDWLRRVDVDTLEFTGSLNNFFPIPIGAGTSISLRNSRDTAASSIVGAATINQTVLPGEVFSFKIQVHNKSLGDSVFFYLDNFNSPAYTSVVFATTPAQLNITLNVVTASYVEVYTNKRFSSVDTVEFSAGIEENTGSLSDTALSGVVNVFSDNGLPANIEGQLYFLDESRTRVLDSFFIGGLTIGGGQTDVAGNSASINSQRSVIPITRKKMDNMRAARYAATRFNFSTAGYPGAFVSANKGPKLTIQFTGDLKISINF